MIVLSLMPANLRADVGGAIERTIWQADAPPPGVAPAVAVLMPTPTPTPKATMPSPTHTPVSTPRPTATPTATPTVTPRPLPDGLMPLHELQTGHCVALGAAGTKRKRLQLAARFGLCRATSPWGTTESFLL